MAKLKHPYLRELVVNDFSELATLQSKWKYYANHKLLNYFKLDNYELSYEEYNDLLKLNEINDKIEAIQNDCINNNGSYELFCAVSNDCDRLNNNLKNKFKRLKQNVAEMIEQPCVFATFTFNDHTLNETTPETRRRYVVRALKQTGARYIANIDFGSKNGREHYHALIQQPKCSRDIWSLNYGNIQFKQVRQTTNAKQLATYITKFTKHSLKKTTDHNIIYSRCSK